MVPTGLATALDVGTADCHIATLLASSFRLVTAIDLEEPSSSHPRITTGAGSVTSLPYSENSFDLVVCSEVLEHIQPRLLQTACNELVRVARRFVLIGVPYNQDIRVGRTKCAACGRKNPPYGHLNCFGKNRLEQLFGALKPVRRAFIGQGAPRTNVVSCFLMDLAGNPYGTYSQQEPCMYCSAKLVPPGEGFAFAKAATRLALFLNRCQAWLSSAQPIWVQVLFEK